MTEEGSDEAASRKEPKRYPIHWREGIRPDESDMEYETVGDE